LDLAQSIGWRRIRLARNLLPGWARAKAAPPLEMLHLEGCLLLPDRETMIRDYLPKHGVVAEIGVARGDNAALILETLPRELHLFDLDFGPLRHLDGPITLHEGESSTELSRFEDYFDWIYVDGDHSYEGVKRDIAAASRAVKSDGLLIFNDYIPFSYVEFTAYGVIQAVNEFCIEQDWRLRYFVLAPRMFCDVAITRAL
jgi:hypothetical protein